MPPTDWEYEFDALVFGGATDYRLTQVEGLDPPDTREESVDSPLDHGAFIIADYVGPRRVTFSGDTLAADAAALHPLVTNLRKMFRPRTGDLSLLIKLPGASMLRLNCRPVRLAFPVDISYGLGFASWVGQFVAGDPRLYDNVESTLAGGGTANNLGTVDTWPTITVTGPSTNPKITNTTLGRFVELNYTVAAGRVVTFDFAKRNITLDDGTNLYNKLTTLSRWWALALGANSIAVAGGGTFSTKWRSAWL